MWFGGAWRLCSVVVACSFAPFFCSGKQALWTVAMFQCLFCPSHSVLVPAFNSHQPLGVLTWRVCLPAFLPRSHLPPTSSPLMTIGGGSGSGPGGTMTRQGHKHNNDICYTVLFHKPLGNPIAGTHGLGQC